VVVFRLGPVASMQLRPYRRGMVHRTAYLLTAAGAHWGHIAVRSAGNERERRSHREERAARQRTPPPVLIPARRCPTPASDER
jgi:hypothetical protein